MAAHEGEEGGDEGTDERGPEPLGLGERGRSMVQTEAGCRRHRIPPHRKAGGSGGGVGGGGGGEIGRAHV